MNSVFTRFSLAALLLLSACSGGTDPTIPPDQAPTASLSGPDSLVVDTDGTFTCVGSDPNGDPISGYTFSPTPKTQSSGTAVYAFASVGNSTVSCTVTANGKTSSPATKTVKVLELIQVQDIRSLDSLLIGDTVRMLLVGTPKDGTWSATATGGAVITLKGDTARVALTTAGMSVTATLSKSGRSATLTKSFIAGKRYVTAEMNFFYGALDDGAAITGTVTLPNGKKVSIANGRASVTPKDSLEQGVAQLDITGRLQSQRRWVNLQDKKRYELEVTGPDSAQYELILGLGWRLNADPVTTSKTIKWVEQPTFIIDDAGHMDRSNGNVRKTGGDSPLSSRLQADDIADIEFFMNQVFSVAVNGVFQPKYEKASVVNANADKFQGGSFQWPQGYVYNGACTHTTYAIDHSHRTNPQPIGVIGWSSNCMMIGVHVHRSGWLSDLLEALGYNTNIATNQIIDAQAGTVKPFLSQVAKFLYSAQRPAGSGRVNGFNDFINNQASPDQPVGAMAVGK